MLYHYTVLFINRTLIIICFHRPVPVHFFIHFSITFLLFIISVPLQYTGMSDHLGRVKIEYLKVLHRRCTRDRDVSLTLFEGPA